MNWSFLFFFNGILMGVGLAMDAFSVSLANGLNEPRMRRDRVLLIAGTFAFFQALMPMLGWVCVHTVAGMFASFRRLIPWIALLLLLWIGGKMLWEGVRDSRDPDPREAGTTLTVRTLLVQGIATSIDALSVGFTISEYTWIFALVEALLIAVTTFGICVAGVLLGKRFGTFLAGRATIVGGVILIVIGLEIFLKGILGG